ncbi:MAG: GAF domain-containing sensor histidine kinase [Actinomycetes bacterium]
MAKRISPLRLDEQYQPSKGQIALATVVIFVLVLLTISTFQNSRTAFREAGVLREAESPAASLIFSQRESLVYATRLGEWVGGTISRREVQIARALLAQRLNVVDYTGTSVGSRADPRYLSTLRELDAIVDTAPSGILGESNQHKIFARVSPILDDFIASARDFVLEYQQAIDLQIRQYAKSRASAAQQNLFLLYALIILLLTLIFWIGLSIARRYRTARVKLEVDTADLESSQLELEILRERLEEKRISDIADLNSRETLRSATREISVSIREYSDLKEMATVFCTQVGELFGAGYVTVSTYSDERVSRIRSFWTDPIAPVLPPDSSFNPEKLHEIVSELWASNSLLYRSGNTILLDDDKVDHQTRTEINRHAKDNGFTESILIPIGEGSQEFGYIFLATSKHTSSWDEYARQSLQFVATHLAYSIVESELIATQRVVEELEKLNDTKNDFISTVNHELRTPLTAIIGYIDLLKDLPASAVSAQARKFLDTLDRNAVALLDLVESMLSLSRLDSTERILKTGKVDLRKVIDKTIFVLEPSMNIRGITTTVKDSTAGQELVALGDSGQLSQVFINLLSNAIKFSPTNSVIEVEFSISHGDDEAETIEISVTDHGIGIPESDIDKLFTRFFRAQNAVEGQLPGTGLGLAIVDRIIRLHGGSVKVESRLAEGTRMSIELPHSQSKIDSFVAERREGVLRRGIEALEKASDQTLAAVSHEIAGAISLYSFTTEGEKLRDLSHWLKKNSQSTSAEIETLRQNILIELRTTLDKVHSEGAK